METKETTFKGLCINGFLALGIAFILVLICLYILIQQEYILLAPVAVIGMIVILGFAFYGLMKVEPNETRIMIFFGKYAGTFKGNGFFWVNPFYSKLRLPVRVRNLEIQPIKVNDKVGNPIMIGAVMVWRIRDTYRARFDIESTYGNVMASCENFVMVQSDAALREVAGRYAYDNNNNDDGAEAVTLRSDNGEITEHLVEQLSDRLAIAGIEVIEARINYLAYSAEIASVMLRRQQADAIISAREKIVEGAVSMVQMALTKLEKENIVKLDDERKAAMVSNLLVVLCADESVQPVVNAGSLY